MRERKMWAIVNPKTGIFINKPSTFNRVNGPFKCPVELLNCSKFGPPFPSSLLSKSFPSSLPSSPFLFLSYSFPLSAISFSRRLVSLGSYLGQMDQKRNQRTVQQQKQEELEEMHHGPFPVEQLQVKKGKKIHFKVLFICSILFKKKRCFLCGVFFPSCRKAVSLLDLSIFSEGIIVNSFFSRF